MEKENKKEVLMHGGIGIVLLLIIWGGFWIVQPKLEAKNLVEDDFSFVFQVDSFEIAGKKLLLEGFAFMLEEDSAKGKMKVYLYDHDKDKIIYSKMEYSQRDDVNQYFKCEYDYSKSGFVAAFNTEKLNLENHQYEILIKYKFGKIYKTDVFFSDGKIIYGNPKDFQPLLVDGTDIESVVDKGILRVWRSDVGIYVYQYNGALYWIADKNYNFEEDGSTLIQYQMRTTQIKNLPEERKKNNFFWSNLLFNFEDYEMKEWNTGEYRVSSCKIPVEYSITYIWTGYYVEDDWVWKQEFRPWYDL